MMRRDYGFGDEDLSKRFPISIRYVFKRSFWLLFCIILAFFILFYINISPTDFFGENENLIANFYGTSFLLIGILFLALIIKTAYAWLYRTTYFYGLEGRHIVISKGVLMKERRSCPINHITDVLIGKTFSDFLFHLNYLEVRTPALDANRSGRIEGLSEETAIALQSYLSAILEAEEIAARSYHESAPQISWGGAQQ